MKYFNLTICLVLSAGLFLGFVPTKNTVIGQYYSEQSNKPMLVVDKKVRPINGDFVDNLSSTQKLFAEGDQIEFLISVSNRGNTNLSNINLVDYLPKYITLLFYFGDKDSKANTVNLVIDNLNPGETKEFIVRARISDVKTSNYSNQILQMSNKACASNSVVSDCDTSKYFIGLSSTPNTGSNDVLIKFAAVITLMIMAIGIRKFARGY